jgi:hypothetical protein
LTDSVALFINPGLSLRKKVAIRVGQIVVFRFEAAQLPIYNREFFHNRRNSRIEKVETFELQLAAIAQRLFLVTF